MEKTTSQQKSGGKVSGESVELPKQNTRSNLNDKSPRKFGGDYGSAPDNSGPAKSGYNRESM